MNVIQQIYLQKIKNADTSPLSQLIEILDLTKMKVKMELEYSVFDPLLVVNNALQLVNSKAHEKNLLLFSLVESSVTPWISGDPWRLRQVLLKLLNNAVKYTHGGMVTVRLSSNQGEENEGILLFEVIDTGMGIAEEELPSLFELFTQTPPFNTRKYSSSGLGLAISKRLVELCGGHMGVESRIGIGSRFWFSFGSKVDTPQPSITPAELDEDNQTPLEIPTYLLLVEDNPINQALLLAMLRSAGHKVDVADSGNAAIEAILANQYDLVLMDVSMPDMDGIEATRRIRQLSHEAASVPIIAMTANVHAIIGYQDLCIAAGMDATAIKPINKTDLLALIEQWCGYHHQPISIESDQLTITTPVMLDESVLLQLAEDAGMDNVDELLQLFMTELVVRRKAIKCALEQENLLEMSRIAHTLKSEAATFGAWCLHALVLEMDSCCKSANFVAVLEVAGRLLPCLDATLVALTEQCDK